MAEFTDKNYSKFFGHNLLRDIVALDKELAEELKFRSETNTVIESFDSHASLALDEVLELTEDEIDSLYEQPVSMPQQKPQSGNKIQPKPLNQGKPMQPKMGSNKQSTKLPTHHGPTVINDPLEENPLDHAKDHPLYPHRVLHNFLHHVTSPWMAKTRSGRHPEDKMQQQSFTEDEMTKKERMKANPVGQIQKAGADALAARSASGQSSNPFHHMKAGFHAAFPDNEDPKHTAQKAKEAQAHFRQFMHERGGHSKTNTANLMGENGKTRKSSGEGVKTVGLAMAPSFHSGYKHDICPKASGECRKNCLGLTAGGNRQYPEASLRAKVLRTHYVHEHPEHAARLISHEIAKNEKDSAGVQAYHVGEHQFNTKGEAMKHIKKNGGQIDKVAPNPHKSGVRLNVTSDIPYEHLMPKNFFDRHKNSQFYDYTKIPGRLHNKNRPENYHLSLSHTGTGHDESNDKDVVHALHNGHVVAMVHHRGKDSPHPTHVEDVQTGKRWKVANGDDDDNTFDRHEQHGIEHTNGHGKEGIVSGLRLKGVTNERAGKFANKVDPDGIIRINHPNQNAKKGDHETPFKVMK